MLTAQWTKRIPILQSAPPSTHATALLTQVLANITDNATTPYTIMDFCSGSGGPIPSIEASVNGRRHASSLPPIQFRLSDLYPDIDAWIDVSSQSSNLSFIPQPVDARRPPPSTISISAREAMTVSLTTEYSDQEISVTGKVKVDPRMQKIRDQDRERAKREMTAETKMIHLFCLSFHHFTDQEARGVIRSSLINSDAFVIIELQERTLGCICMMALEPLLLLLVTWMWFGGNWVHLFWTYIIPVLPVIHGWDGVISCLRTRTFREMRALVDTVLAEERQELEKDLVLNGQPNGRWTGKGEGEWTVSEARVRHTWPAGWLNATVGIRKDVRRGV